MFKILLFVEERQNKKLVIESTYVAAFACIQLAGQCILSLQIANVSMGGKSFMHLDRIMAAGSFAVNLKALHFLFPAASFFCLLQNPRSLLIFVALETILLKTSTSVVAGVQRIWRSLHHLFQPCSVHFVFSRTTIFRSAE